MVRSFTPQDAATSSFGKMCQVYLRLLVQTSNKTVFPMVSNVQLPSPHTFPSQVFVWISNVWKIMVSNLIRKEMFSWFDPYPSISQKWEFHSSTVSEPRLGNIPGAPTDSSMENQLFWTGLKRTAWLWDSTCMEAPNDPTNMFIDSKHGTMWQTKQCIHIDPMMTDVFHGSVWPTWNPGWWCLLTMSPTMFDDQRVVSFRSSSWLSTWRSCLFS